MSRLRPKYQMSHNLKYFDFIESIYTKKCLFRALFVSRRLQCFIGFLIISQNPSAFCICDFPFFSLCVTLWSWWQTHHTVCELFQITCVCISTTADLHRLVWFLLTCHTRTNTHSSDSFYCSCSYACGFNAMISLFIYFISNTGWHISIQHQKIWIKKKKLFTHYSLLFLQQTTLHSWIKAKVR